MTSGRGIFWPLEEIVNPGKAIVRHSLRESTIETTGAFTGTREAAMRWNLILGLVLHEFGRLPKRGESVIVGGFKFTVLRADSRRLHTLLVERSNGQVEQ